MLGNAKAYNGFAVDDLERAPEHLITLHLPGEVDDMVQGHRRKHPVGHPDVLAGARR
jgi:hypothetical protein